MARTQAADYEQRRGTIVDTAARLYATKGFLGASISDLAEALGASKSLVYHYYASKEEILFEVMDSHLQDLDRAMAEVLALALSPPETLRELTRSFMRLYVGAADRHKVLLNELDNLPAEQRADIVSRQRVLIRAVEQLLIEIQPRLKRRKRDLTPTAMLYFGMINWTHTWFRPTGGASDQKVADLAVDITLRGLEGLI